MARGWGQAAAGRQWSFPRDHWEHPGYRNEWWYFTGHLQSTGEPSRRFGYQLTFFRVGLLPERPDVDSQWTTSSLVMGHAAITDIEDGRHRFSEVLYRRIPMLASFGNPPGEEIAWSRAPAGTNGRWTVAWNGSGFDLEAVDERQQMSFRLSTMPTKPVVLHGPGGLSRKDGDSDAASHYYSFTRLATHGSLKLAGESFTVEGESWMDREFSSDHLAPGQAGWDWFGIQLADERDLMLYVVRSAQGEIDFASGTLVEVDGQATYLAASEFSVTARTRWRSPDSGVTYPAGWRLRLPGAGLDLQVSPLVSGQENVSRLARGLTYWEGAVTVESPTGEAAGRGYVELTGYGEGNRPPL